MTIGVVIPSKSNESGLYAVLGDVAQTSDVEVVVIDNGYSAEDRYELSDYVDVVTDLTPSIYALWNSGWAYLWELSISTVVFLNDDVRLVNPEGWLDRLVAPMEDYTVTCPDWTGKQPDGQVKAVTGTYRDNGMCGFAFAVDTYRAMARRALPFDEDYAWWYGDDDFVDRVAAGGGLIGRVGGLHIEHQASTTLNKEDVGEAIGRDTKIWTERRK